MSVKFFVYKNDKEYSGFVVKSENNALIINPVTSDTAKKLYNEKGQHEEVII